MSGAVGRGSIPHCAASTPAEVPETRKATMKNAMSRFDAMTGAVHEYRCGPSRR